MMMLLVIFKSCVLLSHQAFAQGPMQTDSPPWMDKTKYEECGQGCLYRKANENLILQTFYMVTWIQKMEEAIKQQPKGKKFPYRDVVERNLGSYCNAIIPQNPQSMSASKDPFEDCFNKFKKVSALQLSKIRAAYINNNINGLNLKQVPGFKLVIPGEELFLKNEALKAEKLQQSPHIQTQNDIESSINLNQGYLFGVGQMSKSYEDYLKRKPVKEDFPKFIEKLRDPNDPNSEQVVIIQKDQNGNVQYDPDALARSLLLYNSAFPVEVVNAFAEKRGRIGRQFNAKGFQASSVPVNGKSTHYSPTTEQRLAFEESRNTIIDQIEGQIDSAQKPKLGVESLAAKPGTQLGYDGDHSIQIGKQTSSSSNILKPQKPDRQIADFTKKGGEKVKQSFTMSPSDLKSAIKYLKGDDQKLKPGARPSSDDDLYE